MKKKWLTKKQFKKALRKEWDDGFDIGYQSAREVFEADTSVVEAADMAGYERGFKDAGALDREAYEQRAEQADADGYLRGWNAARYWFRHTGIKLSDNSHDFSNYGNEAGSLAAYQGDSGDETPSTGC